MLQAAAPCHQPSPERLPPGPPTRLTSAAAMSMISVGSFRLPIHSFRKLLGGTALNLLAPKAALHGRRQAAVKRWHALEVLQSPCRIWCRWPSFSGPLPPQVPPAVQYRFAKRARVAARASVAYLRPSRSLPSVAVGLMPSCRDVCSAAATPVRPPSCSQPAASLCCTQDRASRGQAAWHVGKQGGS